MAMNSLNILVLSLFDASLYRPRIASRISVLVAVLISATSKTGRNDSHLISDPDPAMATRAGQGTPEAQIRAQDPEDLRSASRTGKTRRR